MPASAEAIREVHVSQAPPTLSHPVFGTAGEPEVRITAAEQGVVQLGAVLSYGAVVAPLQARWVAMQREGRAPASPPPSTPSSPWPMASS